MNFENYNFSSATNQEKEKKLADIKLSIENISDLLGKKIDKGIEDTVSMFMAHDFPTDDSCEGHIQDDIHPNVVYPRVGVYEPYPEGWKDNPEVQDKWRQANEHQQNRMLLLLNEFYQGREVDEDYKLILEPIGIFGGFRVKSNLDPSQSFGIDEQIKRVERARQEFTAFTQFLKDKFFNS